MRPSLFSSFPTPSEIWFYLHRHMVPRSSMTVYAFQGITDDRKYEIALYCPVKTDKLPNNFDEIREMITPILEDSEKYQRYLTKGRTILNQWKDEDFDPDLSKQDFLLFYKNILLNEMATSSNQKTVGLLAMTVLEKGFHSHPHLFPLKEKEYKTVIVKPRFLRLWHSHFFSFFYSFLSLWLKGDGSGLDRFHLCQIVPNPFFERGD